MELFSYVVARDYGFAPNPFFGICTLATCKPRIRKQASIGDWIVGTGSSQNDRRDYLVYAMCITETMTFNEYWEDERFQRKKPNLRGSVKQAFGDNIYFRNSVGRWRQQNSHHSYEDGSPNSYNIRHDAQTDRVLISKEYVYWGGLGPIIPKKFRDYEGCDICAKRNHKCKFPEGLAKDFVAWLQSLGTMGYQGTPLDWRKL